jgi:hypothetical protein
MPHAREASFIALEDPSPYGEAIEKRQITSTGLQILREEVDIRGFVSRRQWGRADYLASCSKIFISSPPLAYTLIISFFNPGIPMPQEGRIYHASGYL